MPGKGLSTSKKLKRASSTVRVGSYLNIFTPSITPSSSIQLDSNYGDGDGEARIRADTNKKLVNEVIDKFFDEKNGFYDVSSSACSSSRAQSSEYSFDKRLKYWRDALADRRNLADTIKKKTGKETSAVIFNRLTTVDERDKQTVKRIMDYAERMNPLNLRARPRLRLPEYVDPRTCITINELHETLPKAERLESAKVEISGLPAIAKEELLGKRTEQGTEKNHQWMKSKVLERRIEDRREDIERVIEYYPDIENLQIVGDRIQQSYVMKHNSQIRMLYEDHILQISSDTSLCDDAAAQRAQEEAIQASEPPEYGVKINEQVLIMSAKRSSKSVEITVPFTCEPFEKVVKRILHLENIGRKVLNFEWTRRPYYLKSSTLLKANDMEFLFNHHPFRLVANETCDIIVQFQPRKVDVFKDKWLLKIDPPFFCRRMDGVIFKLHGLCKPPREYVDKLNGIERNVIAKSNFKSAKSLTTFLGSITPLIKPIEVICPYKRLLDERELFESLNEGYKCERFHDLELLKDIHKRVKKPREPVWDLKVETLKAMIMRLNSADRRALVFDEMLSVLQDMKGRPVELETKAIDNPERDYIKLLYVRGIISTSIDEWEDLSVNIEIAFLKPAMKEYYDLLLGEEEAQGGAESPLQLVDEKTARELVIKKIRRRKAFRDTLYVQTYTHLCNFIEDIVSVIESTEVV